MKKLLLIALAMFVCTQGIWAQAGLSFVGDTSFNPDDPIYKKLQGDSRWYRYQSIILAPSTGNSKDPTDYDDILTVGGEDQEAIDDANEETSKESSIAFSFGWQVTNVWGEVTDQGLKLNKFGFAYSYGFIGNYKSLGEMSTFSCLAKLGIETGNSHPMGIGVDALFGVGTGLGYEYDLDFLEEAPDPYTDWGLRYGFQIWIRTGLVKSIIPNADMNIFLRYVYAPNPEEEYDADLNLLRFWHDEAWSLGICFKLRI